jgi:hypothetical protein
VRDFVRFIFRYIAVHRKKPQVSSPIREETIIILRPAQFSVGDCSRTTLLKMRRLVNDLCQYYKILNYKITKLQSAQVTKIPKLQNSQL